MSTSMTKGSPLKLMLQFALPLLMGNLLQQTYNIIDAAIVGQILGADALASVGSSSSVQFLVLGFCIGCCAGFGVPVARYFGAGDHRTMRNYIFNGAVLTAIIAAILMIACSLSCGQILHLLSVPDDIFGNAYVYLIVIFIGPASYGMTDTMGRMHSDAQFAGSSSVPAHVEMMGLIGAGNNPMVGMTVAVAVSIEEAAKAGKF